MDGGIILSAVTLTSSYSLCRKDPIKLIKYLIVTINILVVKSKEQSGLFGNTVVCRESADGNLYRTLWPSNAQKLEDSHLTHVEL